jgi:hypothetical protein
MVRAATGKAVAIRSSAAKSDVARRIIFVSASSAFAGENNGLLTTLESILSWSGSTVSSYVVVGQDGDSSGDYVQRTVESRVASKMLPCVLPTWRMFGNFGIPCLVASKQIIGKILEAYDSTAETLEVTLITMSEHFLHSSAPADQHLAHVRPRHAGAGAVIRSSASCFARPTLEAP